MEPGLGWKPAPERIEAVINYLKTLWTPKERESQWEETEVRGRFPPSDAAAHR